MHSQERLFYDDYESLITSSLERLQFAYQISQRNYNKPLYIAFSGGKDSVCLYGLASLLAKKLNKSLKEIASFHYNITNLDPPELVNFVKREYKEVILEQPKKTIWKMIEEKGMPPTRLIRYCCVNLKEVRVNDVVLITGVRWQESIRRKNQRGIIEYSRDKNKIREVIKTDNTEERREIENCMKFNQLIINPIVDWSEDLVWYFIEQNNLKYCPLYDKGYKRLGCIGCPMAGPKQRLKQFENYPKYKEQFLRTFDKMLKKHNTTWTSAEECFNWWIKL
jgi:phosphoadenosine phosphosulfate reductase